MQEIIIQNKKVAGVYISNGNFNLINNKDSFSKSLITDEIERIIRDIGFKNKNELKDFIRDFVVGKNETKFKELKFNKDEIIKTIKEVLSSCYSIFEDEIVKIFIFPTIDEFSINKMNGTNGFCVYKNIIFIGLYPLNEWKDELKKITAHELAHALSPYYDMGKMTLGEGFVFDGIAEHFREKFIDSTRSTWSNSISKDKAIKIFEEIKEELDNDDISFYTKVFYGTGKYPLWSGYAIGYYILEDYLKKRDKDKIDWKEIINTSPNEILKESGWVNN